MAKFNEDTRVKIPATIQFLRLGYEYQSLKDIDLHTETRIAINRFKPAIERINGRSFSNEEIQAIIADILSVIKNNDLGKAFYKWLINPQDRVKLIDFDCIENNDFAVVDELTFGKEGTESEKEGSFRPDITVLINGIPLAFLEVKHPNNEGGIQAEFNRMLNKRLEKPEYNAKGYVGDFYYDTVAPAIISAGQDLDSKIALLNSSKSIDDLLDTHAYLMRIFNSLTGMDKRSLASKYLHFHCPEAVFIYDSVASTALRKMVKKPKNIGVYLTGNRDAEYVDFCLRAIELRQYIATQHGLNLTVRELDTLLLNA